MSEPISDADLIVAFEDDLPLAGQRPARWRRLMRRYLPAAVAFLSVLVFWEAFVAVFNVDSFILPAPTEITAAFGDEFSTIWSAGWTTLQEAAGGFVIGVVLAVLVSLVISRWDWLGEGVMPVAIAIGTVPIVALAPVMNAWFSVTSLLSKMAVVALVIFFPVMINTVRGLSEVAPEEIELMRSFASSERELLLRVRMPSALPYFFSALKVASALSMIAAVVAEYFGGRQDALGPYILQNAGLLRYSEAWAAIGVASILGIGLYAIVVTLERAVMPWHVSLRVAEDA